jgi:hypothetical protein
MLFGDPFEGKPDHGQVLRVVSKVVEAGIDDVALSDTIGVANPRRVFDIFKAVREAHPVVTFGAHFHDTRGLASTNTVAALEAGITTFDASVGGLGGSPSAPGAEGNAATEDVVYLLTEMRIETGVDLEWLDNRQSGRRLQRPRRADELDGAGTGHAAHLDLPLDAVNEAIQDLNTGNLQGRGILIPKGAST